MALNQHVELFFIYFRERSGVESAARGRRAVFFRRQPSDEEPGPGYILVVEDNSGDAELLRWSLREHGIHQELMILPDGARAISHVQLIDAGVRGRPALIVLDLNLPKRTGLEVLKVIRDSVECRAIPVAVFSSSSAAKDMQDSTRLGANKYIRKPSNLEDFLGIAGMLKGLLPDGLK
jgi:two-component system, chemotaxis family, response regulator Rcp1